MQYARPAVDTNSGSASTVGRQLTHLRLFVDTQGWTIEKDIFDQAISGLAADRPGLGQRMQMRRGGPVTLGVRRLAVSGHGA